jgi:SPX domain protein involved in polyphosphate accumulation
MIKLDEKTKRQEIKFKIFTQDFPTFAIWLSQSGFFKCFPDRRVNSLYFDTADSDFAYSNMTGQSNRVKVRARWYGNWFDGQGSGKINLTKIDVNLEIKRKVNNLSDKLTFQVKKDLKETATFIDFSRWIEEQSKIELHKRLPIHADALRGLVHITYDRKYYKSRVNNHLRLTLDSNLRYHRHLSGCRPTLLSRDYMICEIKCTDEFSDLASQEIKSIPARRVRFSKYLSAMAQLKNVSY